MKQLRLALILAALALCAARAQRDPEPIPDFTNLDEFVYEPKTTVTFGFRTLSGTKTFFSGTAKFIPSENIGNATDANILRNYHNGDVAPDNRRVARLDENGNVVLDDAGNPVTDPITPDGKTNQWQYLTDRQATDFPGFIALQTYGAETIDSPVRTKEGKGTAGMELAVARDMGKIFNSRFTWNLSFGMTLNDISAISRGTQSAKVTTVTDLYSLFGAAAPPAPYTAPSQILVDLVDADGNPVLNEDGSHAQVAVDNTTLLGNAPVSRSSATSTSADSVTTESRLKGAYYTFRAGPTVWMPITNRFRASVSVAATLIYVGTNFAVLQTFHPESGDDMSEIIGGDSTKMIPGYYADATLQFDVTARTGFYAGAIIQGSGDYDQTITSPLSGSTYSTKVEFGRQHGFRAGMSIKF
jgi:hypothetical protein